MNIEVLGVVPARGGSKGVPRKNIRLLADRPLLGYAVEAAQKSGMLTRFIVTTEDEQIANLAASLGCEILTRPTELAQDDTPMGSVIQHSLQMLAEEDYKPEATVILQPTAPLRRAEHIDEAVGLLMDSNAGSVVSVSPVAGHFHPEWQFVVTEGGVLQTYSGHKLSVLQKRRQELAVTYTRNGAIYAFRTDLFLKSGSFYAQPCMAYCMAERDSVNIDSEEDFWLAERYLLERA